METAIYESKMNLIRDMENKLFDEYKNALNKSFVEQDETKRLEWDDVCSAFHRIIYRLGLNEKFDAYAFGTKTLL